MVRKPKILVVSYNIPQPDKSSGERRFVSILEMLSEFWEIDYCIADFLIESNLSDELGPYIDRLKNIGIRVLPLKEDAFSNALKEHHYAGGYFNLYWIAERMMPLFKAAQPRAFTIVDSVDVHYAREGSQVKLGQIELSKMLQTKKAELGVYKEADIVIAVSKDDQYLLKHVDGITNVFLVPNVVPDYSRKPGKRDPVVIFIGSYQWYPNPDAVKWFALSIWPIIHNASPKAEFLVIGSDPTEEVLALSDISGVKVIGYVPDTKPYLEIAAVSVAPLRIGGGMKGKVNEAMANGIPVVATNIGAQGFEAIHGKQMMITDDPAEFANCVIMLLENEHLQIEMGLAGQSLNSAICSYSAVIKNIDELVGFCNALTVKRRDRAIRPWFITHSFKTLLLYEDIKLGYQLLKREGINEFIHRALLYMKGQRLPDDIQQSEGETIRYNLIKPTGILEFLLHPDQLLVSIIIPVYNQWDYTYACLASILKNSGEMSYEIIVVDDCSTDDTRNIERFVKNIRAIRNEENLGFLFNCNKAAKLASGKYIVLLNNDTLVQPGWLSWFMKTMEENPDVGLAGAKLVFSTGKLQEAGGIVYQDGSAMNYGREDDPDQPQYNYFKDVDYCSGACICVRKDVWDRLDGFDPQFAPAYYEDTDLAMRIRSLGYRTVYQPKSIVIHFEGISHGTDITQGIKKKQDENQKIFYSKWKVELYKNNYNRDENLFKARDKSKHKQTILLIDYNVPCASSHSEKTIQMINHFIELNFNIKFLPDNFLRPEPDVSELEQIGVEILYGEYYRENWQLWIIENSRNINSICFVDVTNKYLTILKSILKHDFPCIFYDQTIKNEDQMNQQQEQLRAKLKEYEKHMLFPAVHYYSPVVNTEEVKQREDEIWKKNIPSTLPGIDLNILEQLKLIDDFSKNYHDIPFPESKNKKFRYYYENPFFSYSDGIFLYSFIRHFNPSRIIEIGSGFSSALILDAIQYFSRPQTSLSFIEPFPDRLYSLLTNDDKHQVSIFEKNLQQIEISFFEQLEENDILFIDSNHVSKTGSDVNYLIFEILPSLKKGVLIHFHDIFYPFEYPKDWVLDGRSWNEDYILRSFLMYNDSFKIILFPNFLHTLHKECFASMPNCYKNSGGSFWLQKVK